jgi:hypothetical protein
MALAEIAELLPQIQPGLLHLFQLARSLSLSLLPSMSR